MEIPSLASSSKYQRIDLKIKILLLNMNLGFILFASWCTQVTFFLKESGLADNKTELSVFIIRPSVIAG